jgi:hypothetical protein
MTILTVNPEVIHFTECHPSSGIGDLAFNIVNQLRLMGVSCAVCSPIGPETNRGSSSLIRQFGIGGLLYYWEGVSKRFAKRRGAYDVAWSHNPLFLRHSPFRNNLIPVHTTGGIATKSGSSYDKLAARVERHCLSTFNESARFTVVDPIV